MGAVSDAMTIQQEDLNFAYDTSISSSELGTVRKELSADIRNLELPDRMIVVELDSKKVGQGVENLSQTLRKGRTQGGRDLIDQLSGTTA